MLRYSILMMVLSGLVNTCIAAPNDGEVNEEQKLNTAIQQARKMLGEAKFQQAESSLLDLSENHPDDPRCWFLLGYAQHQQKKFEHALKAYSKAKKSESLKANALFYTACILSLQGKKDAAFQHLDEAMREGFTNLSLVQTSPDLQLLRSDQRFKKYEPKWVSDSELFTEPSRIIHQWFGENAGDQFGWIARKISDIDADKADDFVTTAPTFSKGAGKIYVYSSKTGQLLHSIEGKPGQRLGNSASGLGDVNGDGIPDFMAGAPNDRNCGSAFVYSGKDASLLHQFRGETQGAQFGYEVSSTADLDEDGTPDVLVGELAGTGKVKASGRVIAYSGKSGAKLFALDGEETGDSFGSSAAAVMVKANEHLIAVGAPNAGPNDHGRVYVYQIRDGQPKLKFKIEGDDNSVNLGQMFISFPGDIDLDGYPDVYASDFSDNTSAKGGGKVVIHSGATGKRLLQIAGEHAGEALGTSPSDAGDVDHDGKGDLVVGAWQNREGALSGGKIYLYSSADGGKLLRTWTCRQAGDTLGFDACGLGDIDGDSHVDFLVTSAWSNKEGPKTGRVLILAGEEYR